MRMVSCRRAPGLKDPNCGCKSRNISCSREYSGRRGRETQCLAAGCRSLRAAAREIFAHRQSRPRPRRACARSRRFPPAPAACRLRVLDGALPDGRERAPSRYASVFSRSSAGFSALLRPVRFLRGFVLRQLSEKKYQFAGRTIRPPGFTGRISVPFASLGGELTAISVKKIILPAAIDAARMKGPNLRWTSQWHNHCAQFGLRARNYVNDRQGYRTVKAAAVAPCEFEISSRGVARFAQSMRTAPPHATGAPDSWLFARSPAQRSSNCDWRALSAGPYPAGLAL
jgi:hypothetical protein